MELKITVSGTPVPQGSKNAFLNKKTGRIVLSEAGGVKLKKWRASIAGESSEVAKAIALVPIDGPCKVTLEFTFKKPVSKPKWKILHDTKPDLDKLTRAVLDGITGPIVTNDSRVVEIVATKRYDDNEGVIITVETIDERNG